MSEKKITASSIVRVAGNIASGMVGSFNVMRDDEIKQIAERSVQLAYFIVSEVEKVETFMSGKEPRA